SLLAWSSAQAIAATTRPNGDKGPQSFMSSPRKRGPIPRSLSRDCGVWVPRLARFACSPGTTRKKHMSSPPTGPREARPDDRLRWGPIGRVLSNKVTEIVPFEILFFDQTNLPIAIPFLQLLFPANGIFRTFKRLDIDQTTDAVLFDELGAKSKSMLFHSPAQIIRHADIERTVAATGKNIDVIHATAPELSSPRRRGPIRPALPIRCGVWVPALASLGRDDRSRLLRRLAHGFPFAQRLRVARRHVGELRVGADGGEHLPRARAFHALGEVGLDRDAGDVRQAEGVGRAFVTHQRRRRGDA